MLLASTWARREDAQRWEGYAERGDEVEHGGARVCGLDEQKDEAEEICDECVLEFLVGKRAGAVGENTIFADGSI